MECMEPVEDSPTITQAQLNLRPFALETSRQDWKCSKVLNIEPLATNGANSIHATASRARIEIDNRNSNRLNIGRLLNRSRNSLSRSSLVSAAGNGLSRLAARRRATVFATMTSEGLSLICKTNQSCQSK